MLKAELKRKAPQLSLLGSSPPDIKQLRTLRRELEAIAEILARPIAEVSGKRSLRPVGAQRRNATQDAAQSKAPHIPFDATAGPNAEKE
jgi:hypothetical protein